jgi:type IV secretory pathway VirB2 component (pilin)
MIQNHFSPVLMFLSLLARGVGQGAISIPSLSAAYASVPKEKLALATTATNIVQRLGGPVATTIMAIVISATYSPVCGPGAFMIAFMVLIAIQLLVLSSASFLPVRIHHNSSDGRH